MLDFGNKTSNNGATSQGKLSAAEFNELVAAVNANEAALSDKVDKETGKVLTSNDYTTEEKTKLAGIAAGAEKNVQSDWNESDSSSDAYIKNKPTIPTVPANVSAFNNDVGYLTAHQDLSSYANAVSYDSQSKKILLKHGNTVLSEIDATEFVKDGMVSDVSISNGYLVVTFNTDSGKQDIELSISQIFDASNYYNKTEIGTLLGEKQDKLTFDNAPTANSNNPVKSSGIYNMCPIIEDTRASLVSTITGVAPFSTLVDGQKILLKLKFNTVSNATLELTLSDGITTTGTKTMKIAYNTSFVNVGTGYTYITGCYIPLIYDGTNGYWRVIGRENDTTYSSMTQANINSGNATTNTVSAKLIHDNAYIVEESYSSGSLKANKFYDFETVFANLTVPSLDATSDLVSNALNFYALRFVAGADGITVSFTNSNVFTNNTPTINTDDYVEIMINPYVINNVTKYFASISVWPTQ